MKTKLCRFVVIGLTAGCAWVAQGQWVDGGAAVCSEGSIQQTPQVTGDGRGGAIVAWDDRRYSGNDIFAQRIDRFGRTSWQTDGVPVCIVSGTQAVPAIVDDGQGGAFVVWKDYRSDSDVYAQHIDAGGQALWTAGGIPVADTAYTQNDHVIAADGFGGVVICWSDGRNGAGNADIYAQRLDGAGNRIWGTSGLGVCTAAQDQFDPSLTILPGATEALTMAVMTWEDERNQATTGLDVYGQKLNLAGTPQWTAGGKAACTSIGDDQNPIVVEGLSGGSLILWDHIVTGAYTYANLMFQRLDSAGNRQLATNGVLVYEGQLAPYYYASYWDPRGVPDGAGGVVFAVSANWGGAIFSSSGGRVGPDGTAAWLGLPKGPLASGGGKTRVLPDGRGDWLFVWYGDIDDGDLGVCGQAGRHDDGDPVWSLDRFYCATFGTLEAAGPDQGGAIVAFVKDDDILAQRIDLENDGHWGFPAPLIRSVEDAPGDEGGWVRLRLRASDYDRTDIVQHPVTGYTVWRQAAAKTGAEDPSAFLADPAGDVGTVFAGDLAGALGLPAGSWEAVAFFGALQDTGYSCLAPTHTDSTAAGVPWETFVVTAHTTIPSVNLASVTAAGYSVDNLAPAGLQWLAGEADFTPLGLDLSWEPSSAADLAGYVLHRGTDPGFVPDAGNLVATTSLPAWRDEDWDPGAGFWYRAAAVDRHGNVGGFAVLGPDGLSEIPKPGTPAVTRLAGVRPNPFNPRTEIVFDLATPGRVEVAVFDPRGLRQRTLASGDMPAGRHRVVWDGRDDIGGRVASGTYLVRMKAGSKVDTAKISLLK